MNWPLLEGLNATDRQQLLQLARRRRYAKQAAVFWEGDPGEDLHLVAKGHAAMQMTTRRGDVATVRVVGPGDHFGELALLSPGSRQASVVALDALETLTLHRDEFRRLCDEHPSVRDVLTEALAREVRRLSGLLRDSLYLDANDHLWCRLDDLVRVFGDGSTGAVVIPLTQASLAELAGVTRQTVHGFLQSAVEKEIVSLDKRGAITVVNCDEVARLARH